MRLSHGDFAALLNLLRRHFDQAHRNARLVTARLAAAKPFTAYGRTPRESEIVHKSNRIWARHWPMMALPPTAVMTMGFVMVGVSEVDPAVLMMMVPLLATAPIPPAIVRNALV